MMVPLKRWRGQHLLADKNILKKIVTSAAIQPTDTVVEIGAGTGNLTALLAEHAKRVIAIEIDKDLMSSLIERFCHSDPAQPGRNLQGFTPSEDPSTSLRSARDDTEVRRVKCGNIEIIHDDARTFSPPTYKLQATSYSVVANIPYNITSHIIRRLLEAEPAPSKMILLIQKEVAQRICAKPPHMSLLSVAVQYYAIPRILFSVPRTCFSPKPNVDSAVIEIVLHANRGDVVEAAQFFRLVTAGFAHKRKYLISNISGELAIPRDRLASIFEKLELPLTARAQELSLDQWRALCLELFPFQKP